LPHNLIASAVRSNVDVDVGSASSATTERTLTRAAACPRGAKSRDHPLGPARADKFPKSAYAKRRRNLMRGKCRVCGEPLPPPKATGRPASYCGPACRRVAEAERTRIGRLLLLLERQRSDRLVAAVVGVFNPEANQRAIELERQIAEATAKLRASFNDADEDARTHDRRRRPRTGRAGGHDGSRAARRACRDRPA
jgi:hypothetical protein